MELKDESLTGINEFMKNKFSWQDLENLYKPQLQKICRFLDRDFTPRTKKSDLIYMILEKKYGPEAEQLNHDYGRDDRPASPSTLRTGGQEESDQLELEKFRMEMDFKKWQTKIQMEHEIEQKKIEMKFKLDIENKKSELEAQRLEKEKELEMEDKRLESLRLENELEALRLEMEEKKLERESQERIKMMELELEMKRADESKNINNRKTENCSYETSTGGSGIPPVSNEFENSRYVLKGNQSQADRNNNKQYGSPRKDTQQHPPYKEYTSLADSSQNWRSNTDHGRASLRQQQSAPNLKSSSSPKIKMKPPDNIKQSEELSSKDDPDWTCKLTEKPDLEEKTSPGTLEEVDLRNTFMFDLYEQTENGNHKMPLNIHCKDSKIATIVNYNRPKNKDELVEFLKMISRYKRFSNKIKEIEEPLKYLMKKNVKFKWSTESLFAFDRIKALFAKNAVSWASVK